MIITPSFRLALAKLGFLIPVCIGGQAVSAADFNQPPQSELLLSLDKKTAGSSIHHPNPSESHQAELSYVVRADESGSTRDSSSISHGDAAEIRVPEPLSECCQSEDTGQAEHPLSTNDLNGFTSAGEQRPGSDAWVPLLPSDGPPSEPPPSEPKEEPAHSREVAAIPPSIAELLNQSCQSNPAAAQAFYSLLQREGMAKIQKERQANDQEAIGTRLRNLLGEIHHLQQQQNLTVQPSEEPTKRPPAVLGAKTAVSEEALSGSLAEGTTQIAPESSPSLLDRIASLRDREQQENQSAEEASEPRQRQPLVQGATYFGAPGPLPKSDPQGKLAGFSSDEEAWQERAANLPNRRGVNGQSALSPQQKPTVHLAQTEENRNARPRAVRQEVKVNFRKAGVGAVCEDASFCQAGSLRSKPSVAQQQTKGHLSYREQGAEKKRRSPTANSSSFPLRSAPQKPGAQKDNSAGIRSARGSLAAIGKLLSYLLPSAHAAEWGDPDRLQQVGAPDKESSSAVIDDESWFLSLAKGPEQEDEETFTYIIGARDKSRSGDAPADNEPPACSPGIEAPRYKEYTLGVSREGRVSSTAQHDERDCYLEFERPEPFTVATQEAEVEEWELDDAETPPDPKLYRREYDWAFEEDEHDAAGEVAIAEPLPVEPPAQSKGETEATTSALDPLQPSRDLSPQGGGPEEQAPPLPSSSSTPPAAPPTGVSVNFPNVNVKEFIRYVSRETGKNFIYNDDELDFNVTIVSAEPISLDNVMAALLQELRIHGFSLIDQDKTLIIHKSRANSPAPLWDDPKQPTSSQIVTRVFKVRHVPLSEIAPIIKQMLSDRALVQVLLETQSLIVTDLEENISRLNELIRTLDLPSKTYEFGQYVATNNFIENLIPLAEQILRPLAGDDNLTLVPHLATNSVFVIAPPVLMARTVSVLEHLDHLEGQTQILSLDRLVPTSIDTGEPLPEGGSEANTLSGQRNFRRQQQRRPFDLSPENLLRQEVGRLDIEGEVSSEEVRPPFAEHHLNPFIPIAPISEKTAEEIAAEELEKTKFHIYRLQYRKGDQLVDALYRIAESLRFNERANLDLINAIVSTQWIESSNSIMITGTAPAIRKVKELIEEIDVPLRQILLEMLVVETSVSDSLNFSVDWGSGFSDQNAAAAQHWQSGPSGSTLLNLPASTLASGPMAIPNLVQQGFQLGVIGQRILLGDMFFSSLGLLVNALHSMTDIDIKLNPKIVVEDNNPAELFVGQNTAFLSQAIVNNLGNIVANNVEFRDVGTRLTVVPQIGNGEMITLVIALEDSQAVGNGGGSGGGGSGGANIGQSSNSINPGPTTATTRTTTKVHVPNKYFVVLSGFIRDQKQSVTQQLPCLGGIPILSGFAKSKTTTVAKRSLMIFIRPQIIETEWEYDEVTRRQQNIWLLNKKMAQPPWQYEVDEALDFFHLPKFNHKECCVPDVNDPSCSSSPLWADPLWSN